MVVVDEELRQLIHNAEGEAALEISARRQSPGIRADGVRLILKGQTTLEEVLRVTQED